MSGVCLIAVFLAVNVVTAPLTPTVWMDEVNYSDPAVHWYLGSGFTSSCWWEQTQDQFWSGNVPGHEFLLCGWLSIFGFGVTAVRSMNFVLAAAGAGLLVAALARAGWLVTRGAQIALLVLFMTGHGITFSYRSGRPDMIGMLLAGIAAFAATLPARPRLIGLAAVGVLTPIAGLQFVVCGVVVAAVAVAGSARSALRPAIVWGVGVGIGLGGLLGLYTAQNTLAGFRASVFPLTGLAQSFADRLTQIPGLYVQDWSLPLLAITALGLAVTGRVGRRAAGCIVLAGLIPLVLFGAGRYPVYYTWMGFVPAAVAVALLLDNAGAAARRWAWIGVAAACVVGLPLRLTLTATEYAARDY
ncbi:MAG TPA: hypothetical protein VH120_09030, partial [Gemmataceae bacterium]|nr:hypothetical protein [Gemmataceae bacterium]